MFVRAKINTFLLLLLLAVCCFWFVFMCSWHAKHCHHTKTHKYRQQENMASNLFITAFNLFNAQRIFAHKSTI